MSYKNGNGIVKSAEIGKNRAYNEFCATIFYTDGNCIRNNNISLNRIQSYFQSRGVDLSKVVIHDDRGEMNSKERKSLERLLR